MAYNYGNNNSEMSAGAAIVILLLMGIIVYFTTLWTDNNLEFWISHIKGNYTAVNNWLSLGLSILLNGVIIILNIIAEIAKLFI